MNADRFFALTEYRFENEDLLRQALTHRSYSRRGNNERLEFLGDSVLGLIISRQIYARFDEASEGKLSRMRAALVKKQTLAEIARSIDLGDYLNLGGGELKSGGYRRESILADALEAIIAAVYLDGGEAAAERVVLGLYDERLDALDDAQQLKDAKTRLQEYLQARGMDLPSYSVDATSGKAHDQTFTVSCNLTELGLQSVGRGSSRKQAEQKAAQEMLARLEP